MNKLIGFVADFVAVAGIMYASWLWNGKTTPRLSDSEYVKQERVFGREGSDAEILAYRAVHEANVAKWKVTNDMLAKELDKRGLPKGDFTAQKSLEQIMFFNKYYDDNVTVEEFVNSQYKDK